MTDRKFNIAGEDEMPESQAEQADTPQAAVLIDASLKRLKESGMVSESALALLRMLIMKARRIYPSRSLEVVLAEMERNPDVFKDRLINAEEPKSTVRGRTVPAARRGSSVQMEAVKLPQVPNQAPAPANEATEPSPRISVILSEGVESAREAKNSFEEVQRLMAKASGAASAASAIINDSGNSDDKDKK